MNLKRHQRLIALFFVVFCLINFKSIIAQSTEDTVITIIENDRDGRYMSKDGNIKNEFINNPVVDINSILNISLSYDHLITKLATNNLGISDDLAKKIRLLNLAMEERKQTLEKFESLLSTYDYQNFKANPEKNIQWAAEMQSTAIAVVRLTEVSDYILEGPGGFRPEDIYSRAETELKRMKQELENQTENKGVSLQFAGWLYKNSFPAQPIHIPGFDSIAPQPSFEVNRWMILPNEEQIQQLQQAADLARANKGKGLSILKDLVDTQINQLKAIASSELNILIESLENELNNLSDNRLVTFKEKFSSLKRQVDSFRKEIELRISFYSNLQITEESSFFSTLNQIQNDIRFLKEEGKLIYDSLNNLLTEAKDLTQTLGTNLSNLLNDTDRLHNFIKSWFEALLDRNGFDKIKELLQGTAVDYELLEFTDQVFKLSLKNIPLKADLDLFTTGVRANGDRLVFKLEVISQSGMIYNEKREIYMYKILPHIEGTVGVIFADPLANTAIETQFQMAPYYNMILKGVFDQKLRRRSISYNRMFDWGVGLHISAPDFDGDDVPELGAGIVLSVLHDYIQSGAAINIFTGDPYWFFGLRLPVPSFNIGMSGNGNN